MRKVAVAGVGTGKFSNRADVYLPELAWEAIKEALDDARLGPEDVQRFVVGNEEAGLPRLCQPWSWGSTAASSQKRD